MRNATTHIHGLIEDFSNLFQILLTRVELDLECVYFHTVGPRRTRIAVNRRQVLQDALEFVRFVHFVEQLPVLEISLEPQAFVLAWPRLRMKNLEGRIVDGESQRLGT